tara:strand:+ start:629 stop:886 length:258 start_codon:yes stop_codon:yes gene_type:complete
MSIKEFIEQELSKIDTKEEVSTASLSSRRKPRKEEARERKPIKRKAKARSASHRRKSPARRQRPARKQRIRAMRTKTTTTKKGGY